jgi:hypothetical protein
MAAKKKTGGSLAGLKKRKDALRNQIREINSKKTEAKRIADEKKEIEKLENQLKRAKGGSSTPKKRKR